MRIKPSPAASRTGNRAAQRRSAIGRLWMAGVLVLLDLALAGLSLAATAWSRQTQPPFVVVGVFAIVGVAVLVVIAAANASAARALGARGPAAGAGAAGGAGAPGAAGARPAARGLATLGLWLAVGWLIALLAVAALVLVAGGGPTADLADAGLFCFAAVAALFAVLLAGLTARASRGGNP